MYEIAALTAFARNDMRTLPVIARHEMPKQSQPWEKKSNFIRSMYEIAALAWLARNDG